MGLFGGIVGTSLGMLISFFGVIGINNFIGAETPFKINWILILGALAGSFLIGAIAGIIPAMNAARENPVDALRD